MRQLTFTFLKAVSDVARCFCLFSQVGMVLNKLASTHSGYCHPTKTFLAPVKPKGDVLSNTLFEGLKMGLVEITSEMGMKS